MPLEITHTIQKACDIDYNYVHLLTLLNFYLISLMKLLCVRMCLDLKIKVNSGEHILDNYTKTTKQESLKLLPFKKLL